MAVQPGTGITAPSTGTSGLVISKPAEYNNYMMLDEVRVSSGSLYSGSYVPMSQPYDTNRVMVLPETGQQGNIAIKSSTPVGDMRVGGARPTYPIVGDIFIEVEKTTSAHTVKSIQQYQPGGWAAVDGAIMDASGEWKELRGANLREYTIEAGDIPNPPDDSSGALTWEQFLAGADELAEMAGLGPGYVSGLIEDGFEPSEEFQTNNGFPGNDEGGIGWDTFLRGVDTLANLAGLGLDWFSGALGGAGEFIPDVDFDANTGFPTGGSGGGGGGDLPDIDFGDGSIGGILSGLLSGLASIGPMLLGILGALAGLVTFVKGFGGFLGEAFAFLPPEIVTVIVVGLSLAIVLMIIRFVRG